MKLNTAKLDTRGKGSKRSMTNQPNKTVARAIVRAGYGRGFVVEWENQRLIITAAHCLPTLPPCHPASHVEERTYEKLLGPLGDEKLRVWAECLFVDLIGDLAVLGSPDNQELCAEADAYEALVGAANALPIAAAPAQCSAWVLSLNGKWLQRGARGWDRMLCLDPNKTDKTDKTDTIEPGMSGSPIVLDSGAAIGALSTGAFNPNLTRNLPHWLLAHGLNWRRSTRMLNHYDARTLKAKTKGGN